MGVWWYGRNASRTSTHPYSHTLIFFLLALVCAPALAKTVIYDDFETATMDWRIAQVGSRGSQGFTGELYHEGKQSLQSETDRHGLTNVRTGFRYQDRNSHLLFWYYAQYDTQDSPDTSLTIGLHSDSDNRFYTTRYAMPAPGKWQLMDLGASDISPLLSGDWIDQLAIGIRGKAVALHLNLDDVRIENQLPMRKAQDKHVTAEAPTSAWSPLTVPMLRAAAISPATISLDQGKQLVEAGINAFILLRPSESELVRWVAFAEERHVATFAVVSLFYDVTERLEKGRLRRAVFADLLPDILPCPIQESYWDQVVTPVLQRWVELSKVIPLTGILLDSSAIGQIHPSYTSIDCCFCDDCFSRFLDLSLIHENVESFPLPQRWNWLREKKMLPAYSENLQLRVGILSEMLLSRLMQTNPSLTFGIFNFYPTWLDKGIVVGFKNGKSPPLVVAREPTISRGYSIAVSWDSQRLQQESLPHRWLPGIALTGFNAEEMTVQLETAGKGSQGYWIESVESLFPESGKETTPLKSPPADILQSLRETNHRLDLDYSSGTKRRKHEKTKQP